MEPPASTPPDLEAPAGASRTLSRVRLALALALPLVLFVVGRSLDLGARFTVDALRASMSAAGVAGMALFVAAFCVGELVQVPGLVFVAAGVLAYGRLLGGLLSFAAAIASVSLTFWVVRGIGGRPLGQLRNRWARRALAQLDARPVRTIALLRLVLILSPPLNYALALSSVRFTEYLVGSIVGLVVPVALAVAFFDWLVLMVR